MQKLLKFSKVFYIGLFLFFVVSAANAQISFVNIQEEVGLQFDRNPNTSTWGDVDNDGDPDVYFCNGDTNCLMLNDLNGSGQFIYADSSIMPYVSAGAPRSVIMGDIENDGDIDILSVRRANKIFLLKNQLAETGNLSFVDIADKVNISLTGEPYYSAAMADYNNDSFLDIIISGIWDEGFVPTVLFKNTGIVDGEVTYQEVSEEAGIFSAMGMQVMQVVWGDYDNDGDQDVFVPTHPALPEFLYRNNSDGTFTDVTVETGLINSVGSSRGSDFIDYDNDGDLDVYITRVTFYERADMDICQLWRNDNGIFHEVPSARVVHRAIRGMAWGDYDNDGDPDLHLLESGGDDILFRNDGNDIFVDVANEVGLTKTTIDGWPAEIGDRGGETWCDWDGDGDLDLLLAAHVWPFLMQNNGGNANNWLEVKLEGVQSNRSAAGARIYVVTAELRQMREVHIGAGYLCGPPLDQHFGLGQKSIVDSLIVRWPSGVQDVFVNVDVNQNLSIKEGSGGAADVELAANSIVKNYELFQNYPNPFNPTTQISYNIIKPGLVRLEIFSILGAKLETIVNESQSVGVHKIEFDASHLATGVYLYQLKSDNFVESRKMVFIQ